MRTSPLPGPISDERLRRTAAPAPGVRRVPLDRPWAWLAAGWQDLVRRPGVSLAYGAAIVIASWVLTLTLYLLDWIFLLVPLAAGFTFVAPLLAVGLYDTSRRLQAGSPASLWTALTAWRRNGAQVVGFGLIVALFQLAWVRVAQLLFALFFHSASPNWDNIVHVLLFTGPSLGFIAVGSAIGAVLAAVMFAIAAVSIPLVHDRPVSVFTAIAVSVAAVRLNWRPMALWAALIAAFTAMGVATLFVGLALTMPLLGHASWHAYRDLVE